MPPRPREVSRRAPPLDGIGLPMCAMPRREDPRRPVLALGALLGVPPPPNIVPAGAVPAPAEGLVDVPPAADPPDVDGAEAPTDANAAWFALW